LPHQGQGGNEPVMEDHFAIGDISIGHTCVGIEINFSRNQRVFEKIVTRCTDAMEIFNQIAR
jgi:hypothetical protein